MIVVCMKTPLILNEKCLILIPFCIRPFVSKESCDKFQLQYFPDVKRFHLIEKGKVKGGIQPQVLKGKESLAIEPRKIGLKVVDKIFDDFIFKRSPYFETITHYSFFVVDKFVLSGSMRSCFLDLFCDEKYVDVVRLDRQTPNMILRDNRFSRKVFKLFDCGDYVNHLISCLTSLNLCKSVLMNVKSFGCLILYMHKSFWIGMFDLMKKMKPLLHFGISKQTCVFKPVIYYFGLFGGKLKYPKLCENNFYDAWSLTKETKFGNFDYNLESFLDHFMWLYVKFKFPLEKLRSTHAFNLGIDSYVHCVNNISTCPFESIDHDDINPFHYCEHNTLKITSCLCVSSSLQVSQNKKFVHHYIFEERRFELVEKVKNFFQVVLRPFASFVREKLHKERCFLLTQRLDFRTSHFEDRGNDVTMPRGSTSSKPDPIKLPKGPIT
ncbi:hypothetical protein PVK06_026977 [Gossypium arboreum]|uniref:Uncharacterized protein n=1 Tax=Gossypium arboreum TaxID=29729 RepID=A0ABR0NZ14_GOSAR|nr:hypothetical protein PVK06_026977 [Gossypium arboreum]